MSTTHWRTFRNTLLRWYRAHGRDLPWRHTTNPYHILVSEIMLQQTQVTRVRERYQRWLKRFPTLLTLAQANKRAVLQEWSGLGYNRRALFLQATAQKIVHDYHGDFPTDPVILQTLPGIGPYTAHALATFAFRQSVPLVDTNIKRVLGRMLLGYKQLAQLRQTNEPFWMLSRQFIHGSRSAYTINQALIDFGAMVCTARQPHCQTCPLRSMCQSYPEILGANSAVLRVKTTRSEPLYFGQPRRIWRGRILQYLHQQPKHSTTLSQLGQFLQVDWQKNRLPWLESVITTLTKDGMVQYDKHRVTLVQ